MALTAFAAILTVVECLLLVLHLSVFVCICRQIYAGVSLYASAFFKIYLLRCFADYIAYLMVKVVAVTQ